jgi:hypothetical protein
MRSAGATAASITAIGLLWAGLAYDLSRPADYRSYHRTVLQVAESAHDAAQTGRLIAEQQLAGQITTPFAITAFDDATKGLAGAQKKFAGAAPPDDKATALRDELAPLLAAEVTTLADTAEATGDDDLRSGMKQLGELAQNLDDFITAHG